MGSPISGYEVYRSPEFKALCERFGIAWDLRTKKISITLTEDEMIVDQQYLATDEPPLPLPEPTDTTTLHNDKFRTKVPSANEGKGLT